MGEMHVRVTMYFLEIYNKHLCAKMCIFILITFLDQHVTQHFEEPHGFGPATCHFALVFVLPRSVVDCSFWFGDPDGPGVYEAEIVDATGDVLEVEERAPRAPFCHILTLYSSDGVQYIA